MGEYKEKKMHHTIRLPNFYEKIALLDSLAYGSVHGGSLVFTDYQIIVKHGCITQLGYYFV